MRILAGQYKGREILPPPGRSITRPITGHVKKSLFAMLGESLQDQTIIDLYCGTGTMGIEALSRGARQCYFAEMDPRVIERLRQNLTDLRATDRAVIWRGDVLAKFRDWVTAVTSPVDAVFIDPPYADARECDWQKMADAIFAPLGGKLSDNDGVAVLRTDELAAVPEKLGPLTLTKQRQYGDMVLRFYMKE